MISSIIFTEFWEKGAQFETTLYQNQAENKKDWSRSEFVNKNSMGPQTTCTCEKIVLTKWLEGLSFIIT